MTEPVLQTYFDGVDTGVSFSAADGKIIHNFVSTCGACYRNARYFSGELSDFVVYNVGVSESEVMEIHQGSIPTHDLVLWGKMNEAVYTSGLVDASGNEHTGVSVGALHVIDPLTLPANETVVNHNDGTVTYTPNAGFTGTDGVQYRVKDDDGSSSNFATVTITVHSILARLSPANMRQLRFRCGQYFCFLFHNSLSLQQNYFRAFKVVTITSKIHFLSHVFRAIVVHVFKSEKIHA